MHEEINEGLTKIKDLMEESIANVSTLGLDTNDANVFKKNITRNKQLLSFIENNNKTIDNLVANAYCVKEKQIEKFNDQNVVIDSNKTLER
jgi:hypothetical protein